MAHASILKWIILFTYMLALGLIINYISRDLTEKVGNYNKGLNRFSFVLIGTALISLIALGALTYFAGHEMDNVLERPPLRAYKQLRMQYRNPLPSDCITEDVKNAYIVYYHPMSESASIIINELKPALEGHKVYWANMNNMCNDELFVMHSPTRTTPIMVVVYETLDHFVDIPLRIDLQKKSLDLVPIEASMKFFD